MSEVYFREKKCINFFDKKFISRFIYLFYCFTISNCTVTPNDNPTIQNLLDYKTNEKDINKFALLEGITKKYTGKKIKTRTGKKIKTGTDKNIKTGFEIIANKKINANKKQVENTDLNNTLTVQQFYESLKDIDVNDKLKLSLFGLNVPLNDTDKGKLDKEDILHKISTALSENGCGYEHLKLLNTYLNWNFLYYVHYILKLDITIPITVFLSILAENKKSDKTKNKKKYEFLSINTLKDFLTQKNILQKICEKLNKEEKQGQNELRNFIINTINKISDDLIPPEKKMEYEENIKHINQQLNNFKHNCANKDNDAYKLYKSILYTFRIAVLEMLLKETDKFCQNVYPYLFSVNCGKCGNYNKGTREYITGCKGKKYCLNFDKSLQTVTLRRDNEKENKESIINNNKNKNKNKKYNSLQERFNNIYSQMKQANTKKNFFEIFFKANLCQFYEFNEKVLCYYKKNLLKNPLYERKPVDDNSGKLFYYKTIQCPLSKEKKENVNNLSKQPDMQIFKTLFDVLKNINSIKKDGENITTPGPITYYVKDSDLLSDF